jgi:hypothetical protein
MDEWSRLAMSSLDGAGAEPGDSQQRPLLELSGRARDVLAVLARENEERPVLSTKARSGYLTTARTPGVFVSRPVACASCLTPSTRRKRARAWAIA